MRPVQGEYNQPMTSMNMQEEDNRPMTSMTVEYIRMQENYKLTNDVPQMHSGPRVRLDRYVF